jgi:acyl-CoA thioesterase
MAEPIPFVDDARQRADRAFLGVELDESGLRGSMQVVDAFTNPRGSFYGGAGVALAVAAMEAATDRRALWTTLQFLSTPMRGERVDFVTEVRQHGNKSSQVRVTTTSNGNEAFTAVGATGVARSDLTLSVDRMPVVRAPEECPPVDFSHMGDLARSRFSVTEHRVAADPADLAGGSTQVAFWARVPGMTASPALLGYVGDVSVLAIFEVLGCSKDGAGTSLDNTLRVGAPADTEWILLDLRGHFVSSGYANATANMWSPDGTLLGSMSQTVVLRRRS